MFRRLVALLILLCLIYFPLGYFAETRGWISMTLFLSIGSGIGAMASIFSLVSFIRPPLTRADVKNLDWESVATVATRAQEIEKLEDEKLKHETELSELSSKKAEMESLVRKASMELFLKEQIKEAETNIANAIKSNPHLEMYLETHRDSTAKLERLTEEIEIHPDAKLLREIVDEVSQSDRDLVSETAARARRLPVFGPFIEIAEVLAMSILGLFQIVFGKVKIDRR